MAKHPHKSTLSVRIDSSIVERVRDLVYWTPELSITSFVEEAVSSQLGQYERERGNQFPKRKVK